MSQVMSRQRETKQGEKTCRTEKIVRIPGITKASKMSQE